jgi:hypothetical protein
MSQNSNNIQLTLHSKPESLSLFDDDFFSSLLPEEGGILLLSAEVSSIDAIEINISKKKRKKIIS